MKFSVSEAAQLWQRVLEKVKIRLDDRNIFDNFFDGSFIHEIKEDTIYVVVNTSLAAQLINTKYIDILHDILLETTESNFKLVLITSEDIKEAEKNILPSRIIH